MLYYLNDRFVESSEAKIHVSDLGLLRGYGIFDFFRCIGNHPVFLENHLDRFFYSAESMDLGMNLSRQQLKDIIHELLSENALPISGIRMLLTGGESFDGYSKQGSSIVLSQQLLHEFSVEQSETVKVSLYEYQRMLPEIKTTNYIIGILKNAWFKGQGAKDMLFHWKGYISELPRSNFFIVDKDGDLCTPDKNVLSGITRKHILEYASSFMKVKERPIHIEELASAQEAFLSGTGKRIIPIGTIDSSTIGGGETGLITRKIMEYFYSQEQELRSRVS